MKKAVWFVLIVLSMLPAFAGRYVPKYDPNGQIDLVSRHDAGGDYILVTVMAVTGDVNAAECLLKFDQVVISNLPGAPYYFKVYIREGGIIPALRDQKLSRGQKDAQDIVCNSDFFARQHCIEAYFITKDDRGREKKDKSAAPAIQFRLVPDQDMNDTKTQVEESAKQGFEQGRDAAFESWKSEKEQMLQELNRLSAENTDLKAKAITQPKSGGGVEPKELSFTLTNTGGWKDSDVLCRVGEVFVVADKDNNYLGEARLVSYKNKALTFKGILPRKPGSTDKILPKKEGK